MTRTMSPPNEESGLSSATEVIGAWDVRVAVVEVEVVVDVETVTVPKSALVVGLVAAVKVAVGVPSRRESTGSDPPAARGSPS